MFPKKPDMRPNPKPLQIVLCLATHIWHYKQGSNSTKPRTTLVEIFLNQQGYAIWCPWEILSWLRKAKELWQVMSQLFFTLHLLFTKVPWMASSMQQNLGSGRASTLALKSVEDPSVQSLKSHIDCKLNVMDWHSVCCTKILRKLCVFCPAMGRYCSHIGCASLCSLRGSVLASEGKRAVTSVECCQLFFNSCLQKSHWRQAVSTNSWHC